MYACPDKQIYIHFMMINHGRKLGQPSTMLRQIGEIYGAIIGKIGVNQDYPTYEPNILKY